MGDPFVLAKLNWIKLLLNKNDQQGAWQVATSGEQPNGVSKELGDQMRKLNQEIERRRADKRYSDYDKQLQDAQGPPEGEIDKIMKQRQEQDAKRKS